jgi:hypothetical protein
MCLGITCVYFANIVVGVASLCRTWLVGNMHVLKCDELKALACIEHRYSEFDTHVYEYEGLMSSEEFVHACDPTEFEDAQDYCSKASTARNTRRSMLADVQTRVAKRIGLKPKPPKLDVPPKKKPKKSQPSAIPFDDADFSQESALAFFPAGTRLFKDRFNGRWRAHWRFNADWSWRDVSRSWGQSSSRHSLLSVCKIVYSWGATFGIECPPHVCELLETIQGDDD